MLNIDQIHLRAVMLCMSKTLKMGKEHTHTFWLITFFDTFDIALIFGIVFNAFNAMYTMYLNTSDIKQCVLTSTL